MLIIFFSVAEDEVCGSKIGDENPKNCCPPGAIELLIAKWLIYSKFPRSWLLLSLFCDVTVSYQQLCAGPVENFEMLLQLKNYDCTKV